MKFSKLLSLFGILSVFFLLSISISAQVTRGTMVIADKMVDCSKGAGKGKCMLVSDDNSKTWRYFYDHIEKFKFRENYTQKIEVTMMANSNPAADQSSQKFINDKTLSVRRTNGQSARVAMNYLENQDSNNNSGNGDGSNTDSPSLTGTVWMLDQLNGKALIDSGPTLVLDGKNNSFSAKVCNTINGDYSTFSGNRIRFSTNVTTRMACVDSLMKLEADFQTALNSVTSYQINGIRLSLLDGNRVVMVFHSADASSTKNPGNTNLEENRWYMTDIMGITIKPGSNIPYIYFDPKEKKVSGFSGCNNFNGTYSVDDDTIEIKSMAINQRTCADPHLSSIERVLSTIFHHPVQYKMSNGVLTLYQNGNEVLRFASRAR
ncbi:MAG: META domain-containing protein [Pyrinomonadaceae bacterium]